MSRPLSIGVLCCLYALSADAKVLGRVFFTPAERQQLAQGIHPWQTPVQGELRSDRGGRQWQIDNVWQTSVPPGGPRVGDRPGLPLLPPGSLQIHSPEQR